MTDPERLISSVDDHFERRILGAAAQDRGSDAALQGTLRALGVAASIGASAPVAAGLHRAAVGAKGAAAVGKILGWVAIGGVAGALSTGGVLWLGSAAGPLTRMARSQHSNAHSATAFEAHSAASESMREPGELAAVVGVAPPVRTGPVPVVPTSMRSVPARASPSPARRELAAGDPGGSTETSVLASELEALEGVRSALARGRSALALERLDAYGRNHAGGVLGPEATVLRVEALFQSGDQVNAADLARRFLASHPESPHAAHLRVLLSAEHRQ